MLMGEGRPHRSPSRSVARGQELPDPAPGHLPLAPSGGSRRPPTRHTANSVKARSNARPRRLPVQPNPLIGRAGETAAARRFLRGANVRLLTLTGPPGVGKTRLAIALAAGLLGDFEHGVAFVDLAPISDPTLTISTIAQTLGLAETAEQPLLSRLKGYLQEKHLLLVLDNFEQVLTAASQVADLLAQCPRLRLLVTSRERLHLSWEHEFPVAPLQLPDLNALPAPDAVGGYPAVALFLERARALKPDFSLTDQNARAVAEICARLDGLPLAIELAAARIKLLPPTAMLVRLESRLNLLTGGARDLTERHQTLRAAIEWSYNLLTPREQVLFHWLSVFVGGFTPEAAQAVCSAEADRQMNVLESLSSLVDKSLVRREETDGEARFQMLATIREYALEQLAASGKAELIRRLHTTCFLSFAEESEAQVRGSRPALWLSRLDAEHGNLRAALQRALESGEREEAARIAGALGPFWSIRGYWSEGRRWLELVLAEDLSLSLDARAKALEWAGVLALKQSAYQRAEELSREGLRFYRERDSRGAAACLSMLGTIAVYTGRPHEATVLLEESLALAQAAQDDYAIAQSLRALANMVRRQDPKRAVALWEDCLVRLRRLDAKWPLADVVYALGRAAYYYGDLERATELLEESRTLYGELGEAIGTSHTLLMLAAIAGHRGDYERSRMLAEESLIVSRQLESKGSIVETLCHLGWVALVQGQARRAQALYEEAVAVSRDEGSKIVMAVALTAFGEFATEILRDHARASALLEESLMLAREADHKSGEAGALAGLAKLALLRADPVKAAELYQDSLRLLRDLGRKQGIAACLEGMAEVDAARGNMGRAARLLGAAESLHETIGALRTTLERASLEQTASTISRKLGDKAFVDAVAKGRTMPLDLAIEEALSVRAAEPGSPPASALSPGSRLGPLTAREWEVAMMIARGFSNREIARTLLITERTTESHVQHILNKLGLHSRTQIAMWTATHAGNERTLTR